ncbi:DNA internalization-related competence protein ComEC/Rec2 [Plesiomonas shigelloides]
MKRFLILDTAAVAVIAGTLPLVWLNALPSWLLLLGLLPLLLFRLFPSPAARGALLILGVSFIGAITEARQFLNESQQLKSDAGYITIIAQIKSPLLKRNDSRAKNPPRAPSTASLTEPKERPILVEVLSGAGLAKPFLARLSVLQPLPMQAGEHWQLQVKLRPLSGRENEGGFDAQRWMISEHILATGLIKQGIRIGGEPDLRQRLISRSLQQMADLPNQDVLLALAFGERSMISDARWQVFQYSGIAHLMAISGLHVLFAGLCGFMLCRLAQWCLPMRWMTPLFPLLGSALAAGIYVWLAGGNLPAQRTLFALILVLAARCLRWQWRPVTLLLVVMALLLLIDPLTVLSDSFWLSCLAVSVLLVLGHFFPLPPSLKHHRWLRIPAEWLHIQLGLTLLLAPVQLAMFHGLPLQSLLANVLAIPLITFVTVPLLLLALLTSALPVVASVCWLLADISIRVLWPVVTPLAEQWQWLPALSVPLSLALLVGVMLWRLGLHRSAPVASVLLVILLLLPLARREPLWRVDMLDIGQGLAMVLSRNGHAIVYDTGSSWDGGSMATLTLLPFLRWHGLTLDGIILSHQDNDHAGGLPDLQRAYPDAWLRLSGAVRGAGACHRGLNWQWQGLGIQPLWPLQQVPKAGNTDSCTLLVTDGRFRVLLTGDIDAAGEAQLVQHSVQQLVQKGSDISADIMTIPHHGSRTSSTLAFLQAVQPQAALVSAGRFNQWRHPRAEILARYQQQQIPVWNTIDNGQISVHFFPDRYQILTHRRNISPVWYRQLFGALRSNG